MTSPRLLLVFGASAIGACPLAMAAVDRRLQVEMQSLARQGGGLLLTAGAAGPEVHAEMLALTWGVRCVAYLPSGVWRENGLEAGRWTGELLRGSAGVVRRDEALLSWATDLVAQGYQAEVLALLEADASPRSSSLQRTQMAERAGWLVRRVQWDPMGGFVREERGAHRAALRSPPARPLGALARSFRPGR